MMRGWTAWYEGAIRKQSLHPHMWFSFYRRYPILHSAVAAAFSQACPPDFLANSSKSASPTEVVEGAQPAGLQGSCQLVSVYLLILSYPTLSNCTSILSSPSHPKHWGRSTALDTDNAEYEYATDMLSMLSEAWKARKAAW